MTTRHLLALSALLGACTPAEAGPADAAITAFSTSVSGTAVVGQPAPDFELPTLAAEPVKLSSLQGQTVILEWFNPGCPFVKHVWDEDVMPPTVKKALERGNVTWLAINSSAPGKQGHGVATNSKAKEKWDIDHRVLLDETGVVGKAYDAKTTPQMYIIDPAGVLVYDGAIDDAPLGRKKGGEPVNYVNIAMDDLAAGNAVGTAQTQPYGCSVKYGS